MPARLIESLIALSIAYVAIENFTGRMLVHRWMVTFLFGLVHGFGFSNVLREMGLARSKLAVSLFSFNLGVEIGQLVFVAVLFPLLLYIGRSRWKEQVMSVTSVAHYVSGFLLVRTACRSRPVTPLYPDAGGAFSRMSSTTEDRYDSPAIGFDSPHLRGYVRCTGGVRDAI